MTLCHVRTLTNTNNRIYFFSLGGIDLAFMVDASSNVKGEANFKVMMNFAINVFNSFTMGSGVRYGLALFASSLKVNSSNSLN